MVALTSGVSLFNLIVVVLGWIAFSVEASDAEASNTKWQSSTVLERNKYMYNNSFMSDIRFTFGNNQSGEVFYTHKYVLATSSPVFYEMFYSKSGKNITHIHLPNSKNETIAAFLRFLYEDECPAPPNVEEGLKILHLVMYYQVASFNTACKNYLEPQITAQNAYKHLEEFLELKAERFVDLCFGYIDTRADEYFTSEYFLNIKLSTLNSLLKRDTLECSEVNILKAVVKWVDRQCSQQNVEASRENRRMILGNAIYDVRFMLMTLSEFTANVIATNILSDHESISIIKAMVGHDVSGLTWDSPGLRSPRRPAATKCTTYFSNGALITIVCALVGFCCMKNWTANRYYPKKSKRW